MLVTPASCASGKSEFGAGALAGVVGQRLGEAEGGPDQRVRRSGAVGVLGQRRQGRLQLTGCGEQPASHRVPAFGGLGVPLLAQLDHLALEGLPWRVGGEVVLTDPVLADDDGIVGGHGQTSFPATGVSAATTTSSGRTSCWVGANRSARRCSSSMR